MLNLNTIYNKDCLIGMQEIQSKSIDFIITDLPYGTTDCSWDVVIPFDKLWKQYKRIIKENGCICLFGQEPFSSYLRLSNIEMYKYDIYWQKERPTNVFQIKRRFGKVIETISVFYNKQPTYNPQMIKYNGELRSNKIKNGKLGFLIDSSEQKPYEYVDTGYRYPLQVLQFKRDILHCNLVPTQKPLALCEYLIKTFTNENDVVLDSCIGSGTTMLAARNLNRFYIGFEKDESTFLIAKQRLELT